MAYRPGCTRSALAILLALLRPPIAAAYQQTIDAASLHEAYVLGQRNDAATAGFLAGYVKAFTTEAEGNTRVTQIEVLTPFAAILDRSRRNTAGYSEQQAWEDYEKYPNTVAFNVTLMLPAAYLAAQQNPTGTPGVAETTAGQEDFWQRFRFDVKQQDKLLPLHAVRGQPIYSAATADQPAVLDGANVSLEFEVKDVSSIETIVEVMTPEGKTISAIFDLKKLR